MAFKCNFCVANVERLQNDDLSKNWPVPYCPNICSRTQKQRDDEANARLNNRIYFNGITLHGYQQPIREAINPRYRDENVGKPKLTDFQPPKGAENVNHEKLAENFRSIDVYSGLVDGRHYGRFNRLKYQKRRHTRNTYGTEQRFCVPAVNNYNYGWWVRDLPELNKTKWYLPRERFPTVRGEVTKFVDELAKHDPNFLFF
jgi:hypothetical protein